MKELEHGLDQEYHPISDLLDIYKLTIRKIAYNMQER